MLNKIRLFWRNALSLSEIKINPVTSGSILATEQNINEEMTRAMV
jgi:hypothetical protein